MHTNPLILFGVGQVAWAVASQANGKHSIIATTRSANKCVELKAAGIDPILLSEENTVQSFHELSKRLPGSQVIISFPPDGITDAKLAKLCHSVKSLVYISSTSVYGSQQGIIDYTTPTQKDKSNALRLDAEAIWQAQGAAIIRAPGIYGPKSGLHLRLRQGDFQLIGNRVVSRIHVDDLATLVLAALSPKHAGKTFVVGDLNPVPQQDVIDWLCKTMNVPLPSVIEDSNLPTQCTRGRPAASRAVNSSFALQALGISLKYPSYKEGFAALLDIKLPPKAGSRP